MNFLSNENSKSLVGKNVTLRPITIEDTKDIVRWRNSEEVRKYFLDRSDITEQSHNNWLKNKVFTGEVAQFVITLSSSGDSLGTTFIKDLDFTSKKGEFGIFIGETDQRGKGVGFEATRLITEYGFDVLGLNKVYLRVIANNHRAVATYKRVGYSIDGTLRKEVYDNGKYEDVVIMSMLKSEFIKGVD